MAEPPALPDPAGDSFISMGFSSDSWLACRGGLVATLSGMTGDTELVAMLPLPLCDLGKITPSVSPFFPLRKTGDSTSSPPHRSTGTAHHNPWGQRPQREGTAGERGTAPRSRGFLRAQNRVSCLPITRRSHEPGQIFVFQSCPAPAVAPTPYGTGTLPVRQQQRRLRAGTQLHVYSQTLAEVIQG